MSDVAIRIDRLGKKYRIRHQRRERYRRCATSSPTRSAASFARRRPMRGPGQISGR